jgi:hypothetical protein
MNDTEQKMLDDLTDLIMRHCAAYGKPARSLISAVISAAFNAGAQTEIARAQHADESLEQVELRRTTPQKIARAQEAGKS